MSLTLKLLEALKKRGIVQDNDSSEKCPNAANMYHTCVKYCCERYGHIPSDKDVEGWFLVPHIPSGKSYYWNSTTNQVSWLHPFDPRSEIVYGFIDDEWSSSLHQQPLILKYSTAEVNPFMRRPNQLSKRTPDFDPMDPAAYSEAPAGNWSTGLESNAKSSKELESNAKSSKKLNSIN